jgi:hypothetical protein
MTYRCLPEMNITKWINDMQRLYNSLCDLDLDCLSDHDFTLTILDLLPQDDGWMEFLSVLQTKVRNCEALGLPLDSVTFTTAIREEYWAQHKDDNQTSSNIFSARQEYQKCFLTPKRQRSANLVATASSPSKHPRTLNPEKANLRCENSYCAFPQGHKTADCITYKGAKEGPYREWWREPWNIHLPENQRSKENNKSPKSHPAYAHLQRAFVNQSHLSDISSDRSTTSGIVSLDDSSQANAVLGSGPNCHVWITELDDKPAQATLPILNSALL